MVFRNLSAQLSRRSIDVHCSWYQATNEADVRAFKSVRWSFERNLALEQEPDLLHHWKYYYERTIGCVGMLKDWFTRALAEALEQSEKTLSRTLLEQHAFSVDRCGQMVSEAVAGETAPEMTMLPTACVSVWGWKRGQQNCMGKLCKKTIDRKEALPHDALTHALDNGNR